MTVYLGFSGRAAGLTEPQKKLLRALLDHHDRSLCMAIHNDGEGADQEFAAMALQMGFEVETTSAELKPMQRNRALVGISSKLFAAPPTDFILKRGSGTWETVKYMWKAEKPAFLMLSDGSLVVDPKYLPKEATRYDSIGLVIEDLDKTTYSSIKEALLQGKVPFMHKL